MVLTTIITNREHSFFVEYMFRFENAQNKLEENMKINVFRKKLPHAYLKSSVKCDNFHVYLYEYLYIVD